MKKKREFRRTRNATSSQQPGRARIAQSSRAKDLYLLEEYLGIATFRPANISPKCK